MTTLPALARSGRRRCEVSRKFHEAILLACEFGVFAGEIAVVLRLHFATVNFLDVAAFQNPVAAQRGQPLLGRAGERGVRPTARSNHRRARGSFGVTAPV